MVELVYKFDEKSTASVYKGESTAKVPFKLVLGHIHTYSACLSVCKERMHSKEVQ